ncbi:hypothetical protein FSP39_001974 [Pinctada imbricata]|uniref:Endonuclease/exonuclease/phosphatase domain-containing protein n=1 Tax=Pinctada imbricata TaxID=66713 RepID=A0AA88YIL6_PINIB|nr:hypothetical protein FSP39_001974 [Pinctada imbricata]
MSDNGRSLNSASRYNVQLNVFTAVLHAFFQISTFTGIMGRVVPVLVTVITFILYVINVAISSLSRTVLKDLELEQFVIIGDHTKPKNALSEIDSLRDVYDKVLTEFGDQAKNVLIAGDLNADCSYLHKEEKAKLRIRQGSLFNWLIKEDTDTTVGNSDCAYDRFGSHHKATSL